MRSRFMKCEVDVYFGASLARIPRALRIYHFIEFDDSIWSMFREGDLERIQAAFADGSIDPFATTQRGLTLLSVSVSCKVTSSC